MQLISIQYLRALAATMVVFFHLGLQLERMGYHGYWPSFLASGVDIFFVISGYIMWATTSGKTLSPSAFMKKRIARIGPLYWIITLIFIALMIAAPNALQSSRFDLGHSIASLLFIPYPHPVLGALQPVVVPGWTLNYEMFFYAVFSVGLLAPLRLRFLWTAGVLLALVGAGAACACDNQYVQFYTSGVVLEFALGMAIAVLSEKKLLISARAVAPMIAASVVAIAAREFIAPQAALLPTVGFPAALIVYAAVSIESRGPVRRLFLPALIGDASYSLYLIHGIALSAEGQMWRRLVPTPSALSLLAFALFAVACAIILAVICHRAVELPASRWLSRRLDALSSRRVKFAPERARSGQVSAV